MGYNLFQPATLGMKTQAHALTTIGNNVANVNTGGYKRTDTRFETMISQTLSNQTDLGGIKPKDFQRIDNQGFLSASDRDLDLAISGDGFFYVSPTITVSDEIFFTRNGSFEVGLADAQTSTVTREDGTSMTVNNGYLMDRNGYFVLGEAVNATDGTFSTGSMEPIRIDEWAYINTNTPTSTASIGLNLPTTNENISDHLGTVLSALSGTNNDNLQTYDIEIVDSNGAKKSAQLNFTNQSNNVWQVSATTDRNSSPQADTINFGGTAEANDTYAVTVNIGGTATTVNYTSTGAEGGLSGIRDAIVTAINADATIAASVTAAAGKNNGEIALTANAAGTSFTTSASATDGSIAQKDTISIAGTVEAGDVYEFTLASTDNNISTQTISYTVTGAEGSLSAIRDNIVAAFEANGPANATVAAAAGAAAGEFTLNARTAGKAFTATASTPTTGATVDNTATVANTTANVTGTADNTATVSANTSHQTSLVQTLNFDGNGRVTGTAPVTMNFSLTFADAATSTFALNVDNMTQFGSGFLAENYSHNGLASAHMRSVNFDDTGRVIGSFTDGTTRAIYKLPLAIFQNPNQLEMLNGMVFKETSNSGSPEEIFADTSQRATFVPLAFEISNVDLTTEFTRMIMVQKAYNSSATVFRTVDEMVQTGRDLKA
jgi:flagellar hook protein FlgE